MYKQGFGVEKNIEEAIKYLDYNITDLEDYNNNFLAYMYLLGDDVEQNDEKVADFYGEFDRDEMIEYVFDNTKPELLNYYNTIHDVKRVKDELVYFPEMIAKSGNISIQQLLATFYIDLDNFNIDEYIIIEEDSIYTNPDVLAFTESDEMKRAIYWKNELAKKEDLEAIYFLLDYYNYVKPNIYKVDSMMLRLEELEQ